MIDGSRTRPGTNVTASGTRSSLTTRLVRERRICVIARSIAFMAFAIAVLRRSRRPFTVAIRPSSGINTLTLIRSWFSGVNIEKSYRFGHVGALGNQLGPGLALLVGAAVD
jgi:hypothetical protein